MRRRKPLAVRSRPGFTLIELLVVIVILGILMAVAVPTFLRQQTRAQDSRTEQYLTMAFKAIRTGTPDTGNRYPSSTSMVSWVQQSEPELTVQRSSCYTGTATAPPDAVLVDPSTGANSLLLCARSTSGNVWELSATATGAPTLINGTLVPLAFSGNEITDATRAASVQGDGITPDSSTGVWESTTNLIPNGGLENGISGWSGCCVSPNGQITRSTVSAKFGTASLQVFDDGQAGTQGAYSPMTADDSASAGQTWTGSVWVDSTDGVPLVLQLVERDPSGAWIASSNFNFTPPVGVWKRYTVTRTLIDPSTTRLNIRVLAQTASATTYYLDGVQVEQKPFATPYVDTNGTTATRPDGSIQASAALLNPTQGWIATRVRLGFAFNSSANNFARLFEWRTDGTHRLVAFYSGDIQKWSFQRSAGTGTTVSSTAQTFSVGTVQTIILAWTASTITISVNGGSTSVANTDIPSLPGGVFDIASSSIGFPLDGDMEWFATGMGLLTASDFATINGWGSSDPTRASFPQAHRRR